MLVYLYSHTIFEWHKILTKKDEINHMNLSDIKKEYNAVFSLGQNCRPAWALYQLELSPFFWRY